MTPAISVDGLRVNYRDKKGRQVEAVRGLSFQIAPGEIVGFLGPNGAGKSSTLKALIGFVEPTAGKAEVFGLAAGSVESRKRIGYLPEVALYYPYLTPVETLTLYGQLQGIEKRELKRQTQELLELVGLGSAMKKQNRQLSKGMLQRVGIAQSLLGSPELLILDEVTSGLDPLGRQELRNLLKDRQKQGATLFFSSHELSEVDMLCDRVLLVDQGVLIDERQMGDLKEELRKFAITYRGALSLLDLAKDWTEVSPGVYTARFDGKESLLSGIARAQTAGVEILDVTAQEGSLEEYFVESIRRAA